MKISELLRSVISDKKYEKIEQKSIIYLLMHVENIHDYTQFIMSQNLEVENLSTFLNFLERLKADEPLAYIINRTNFLDLELYVDENVLIPRPETEELTLKALSKLSDQKTVLDLCTGSGAIALYLKSKREDLEVYASDIDLNALDVARKNALNLSLGINFLHGDLLKPLIDKKIKVDVLISNPPYVGRDEIIDLSVEKYEPELALFASPTYKFYEEILKDIHLIINEKHLIAFEINPKDKEILEKLVRKYLKDDIFHFENDIYGKTRFLFIESV